MQISISLKRSIAGVLALALLAVMLPAGAHAQATTIYADLGRCRTNVDNYQVQLQAGDQRAPDSAFPASVSIHFADGTTAEATPYLGANFGTKYYYLDGPRNVEVTTATAEWDTTRYPNYRFTVSARPCLPEPEPEPTTAAVTGTIVQRGNERPVADLTVCLVEADVCTITDAGGNFAFTDVEYGTYTLTSDGDNWKLMTTTVTVADGDVHLNLIQFKGGGKGK